MLNDAEVGATELLERSLQVAQKDCEELSGQMVQQTVMNDDLEQTVATMKDSF